MFKKTLGLLGIFLLCGCIKANAVDMVIKTELYPSICDFRIYKSVDNGCFVSYYWQKFITLKNDYQRKLFEQINNFKIPEKSDSFNKIFLLAKQIHDLESELEDDINNFATQDLLARKEKQLLEFCLNLKKYSDTTCLTQ